MATQDELQIMVGQVGKNPTASTMNKLTSILHGIIECIGGKTQSDWNQNDNTKADDIKNKPTIPASQIQSDWSQSDNTALDFIKNKPSNLVDGTNISHIVKITQSAYDLLPSKDAATLYVIIEES